MANNLKEFRKIYNFSQEQMVKILGVQSVQSIKNYESGNLPLKKAIILSEYAERKKKKMDNNYEINEKNFISLDWIYCRSPYMNDSDVMSNILFSLTKIFDVASRKTHNGDDTVLLIDSRFRDFLFDMKILDNLRLEDLELPDEALNELRKNLYSKHVKYLREIFSDDSFNNNFFEIHSVENLNEFKKVLVMDIISNKGKDMVIKTEFQKKECSLGDGSDDKIEKLTKKKFE